MRAEAENANVRARASKDVDDTRQYAVQKFAADVVEAADNLKRGIHSLPPPRRRTGYRHQGARRPGRRRTQLCQHAGAERHQAGRPGWPAHSTPTCTRLWPSRKAGLHPPGTIIQAWSKAWTLNGRLLSPAMVVVAKAAAEELAGPAQK